MKLKVKHRAGEKKSELTAIRREGDIPAVIYAKDAANKNCTVNGALFQECLRKIAKGSLPSVIFDIEDESGKVKKAIVKGIQYHTTTYNVIHLDFLELLPGNKIKLNVPILFKGAPDCPGVKLGGVLRPVLRHLKVRCLPENIPASFEMDVSDLSLNQSKRLSSITLPEGVEAMKSLKEVAVIVAKK